MLILNKRFIRVVTIMPFVEPMDKPSRVTWLKQIKPPQISILVAISSLFQLWHEIPNIQSRLFYVRNIIFLAQCKTHKPCGFDTPPKQFLLKVNFETLNTVLYEPRLLPTVSNYISQIWICIGMYLGKKSNFQILLHCDFLFFKI